MIIDTELLGVGFIPHLMKLERAESDVGDDGNPSSKVVPRLNSNFSKFNTVIIFLVQSIFRHFYSAGAIQIQLSTKFSFIT